MEIKIYQINLDRDTKNRVFMRFVDPDHVDFSTYDEVWNGEVECEDLEDIFTMFNLFHPIDYKGRSLSVSDIVFVSGNDNVDCGFYFCDSIGWEEIDIHI